jgi:hypothetical protein
MLVEATAEVAAAETSNAPKFSPFEYVAAEEYLHKAREEQSYSEFETAETLATKARDCARLARAKAEAKMRTDLGASAVPIPPSLTCEPAARRGSEEGRRVKHTVVEPKDPKDAAEAPKGAP